MQGPTCMEVLNICQRLRLGSAEQVGRYFVVVQAPLWVVLIGV